MRLGDLMDGLHPAERLQSHLSLELRRTTLLFVDSVIGNPFL
jgi:hypothetical protein